MMRRQYPQILRKMMPSAVEARRFNRQLKIKPNPGATHQDTPVVKVTDEFQIAVRTFAKKLAKSVYFFHTNRIFPKEGGLALNWFTNVELFKKSSFIPFQALKDVAGLAPPLIRNKKSLNGRFSYKISISKDSDLFALQATVGTTFGLIVFGSATQGKIEKVLDQVRTRTGRKTGGISLLQSPTLG
jgi:hypothetical protein